MKKMNEEKLSLYKFNTTIKLGNSIMEVQDTCKHFTLQDAIENVRIYNLDRGFEVITIEPIK